jgi:hypothetical protein
MARKKAVQPANAGAEAIMPLTDFRGDPWKTGDKNAVAFRAGILSSPVPAGFAQRMRDEGKAVKREAPSADAVADTAADQSSQG